MGRLSQENIDNLGKQIGRSIESRTLEEVYDPKVQTSIHIGAIINKDALINEEIIDFQKFVPEDVDDSF